MNPVAFISTIDEAYNMLIESGGEMTPAIAEMLEIVDSQKEMALEHFVDRRFDREQDIAAIQGRNALLQKQIEANNKYIAHQEKVIETADAYIIRIMETMTDAKSKPITKLTISGQQLKITTGTSNKLIVDDATLIPDTFIKCQITFPKDRLELIKMVLDESELKNLKESVDLAGLKSSGVTYQGTHYETTQTKHIKREG